MSCKSVRKASEKRPKFVRNSSKKRRGWDSKRTDGDGEAHKGSATGRPKMIIFQGENLHFSVGESGESSFSNTQTHRIRSYVMLLRISPRYLQADRDLSIAGMYIHSRQQEHVRHTEALEAPELLLHCLHVRQDLHGMRPVVQSIDCETTSNLSEICPRKWKIKLWWWDCGVCLPTGMSAVCVRPWICSREVTRAVMAALKAHATCQRCLQKSGTPK